MFDYVKDILLWNSQCQSNLECNTTGRSSGWASTNLEQLIMLIKQVRCTKVKNLNPYLQSLNECKLYLFQIISTKACKFSMPSILYTIQDHKSAQCKN